MTLFTDWVLSLDDVYQLLIVVLFIVAAFIAVMAFVEDL